MSSFGTLNVTTLAASNGSSTLECWSLDSGFTSSSQAGTTGAEILQLGNLANASYSVIPAQFAAGLHNAPNVQYVYLSLLPPFGPEEGKLNAVSPRRWVVFLAGEAHITLPNGTDEAWVLGGRDGMILAVDTSAVSTYGHNTTYPSNETTIALQIPIEGGLVPNHTVVHTGPCVDGDQLQRRSLEDLD